MTVQDTGLERELEFFNQHRNEYLERFPGLFVLIRDEQMRGPFPTAQAAYEEGLRSFGLGAFLVKQVLAEEPVGYVPAFFSTHAGRADL